MEKLYVLVNSDNIKVSPINTLTGRRLSNPYIDIEIIIKEAGGIYISYVYNSLEKVILPEMNLRTYFESEDLKAICVEMTDQLTDDFQSELKSIYPGPTIQIKLYNFFIVSSSIHLVTFDILRLAKSNPEMSPFYPWEMIMPEYDDVRLAYSFMFYKCFEYYIQPIHTSGKLSGMSKVLTMIITKLWILFGDIIRSGESDEDNLPSTSIFIALYGSILNMYKFSTHKESFLDPMNVLSDIERKHLDYIERGENIYNHFIEKSEDFSKAFDVLSRSENLHVEIASVLDECNTYANELKAFVDKSKIGIQGYIKELVKVEADKLDEILDSRISEKVGMLSSTVSDYFKSMEEKHEYKLIKVSNDILSKRDEFLLLMHERYNEYQSKMNKIKQDHTAEVKTTTAALNKEMLGEYKDVASNIHKYKGEVTAYIQLKRTELETDIKKIVEKEVKKVIADEMQGLDQRVQGIVSSALEDLNKSILLLADKVKALETSK